MKKNLLALLLGQASTLFFPIIASPLVARRLGVEGYGDFATAIAFGVYFSVAVEWGFGLTATRAVAVAGGNFEERSKIFWNVVVARAIIFFLLAVGFIACFPLFSTERKVIYFLALAPAAVGVLNANFLFQGLELSQALLGGGIAIRAAALVGLYGLVQGPHDVGLAVLLFGLGSALPLAYGFSVALVRKMVFCRLELDGRGVKDALLGGSRLFFSGSAMTFYASTNLIILDRVSGALVVAQMSAAHNVVKAACAAYAPLSLAFFPRMAVDFSSNAHRARRRFLLLLAAQIFLGGGLSFGLYAWGGALLRWYFGSEFGYAADLLKWLSPLPVLLAVSNVLGVQYLLPRGQERAFSRCIYMAAAMGFLLSAVLVPTHQGVGAVVSLVVAELTVVAIMSWVIFRTWREGTLNGD